MKTSLIITAFKEPQVETAILAALNQNTNYKYDIIVSAPDKETEEIIKKYLKVKLFKDPGKGKSFALNLLFKKIKSDILILTDGDVFISENAIEEILKKFKDEKVGCVTGRPVAINKKTKMIDYFSNLLLDAGAHKIRQLNYKKNKFIECTGYLFAIRNGIIKENPHLDVAEDSIIPYLIWKKGYRIAYAEKALVYVKYPSTLKDFIKQRKRAGVGSHSKLDFYYPDFPRVKTFKNEILKGTLWALSYPKNIKEFFWTLTLFPIRLYIWFIYYFEAKFKKKYYKDGWDRINSTK